jgi:hypothetical protein
MSSSTSTRPADPLASNHTQSGIFTTTTPKDETARAEVRGDLLGEIDREVALRLVRGAGPAAGPMAS